MQVEIDGNPYTWSYQCGYPQDVCSGSNIDCFRIIEMVFPHSKSNLTLNFTSLITETNSSVKYWGVKDLSILSKNCYSRCESCNGPSVSECTSCVEGFFLQDSTCTTLCNEYTIPKLRKCGKYCPLKYFSDQQRFCHPCPENCMVCKDGITCEIWEDGTINQSLWEKHLYLWIMMIIFGFLAVFFIFWKCLIKKHIEKIKEEFEEEEENEGKTSNKNLEKKMMGEEVDLEEGEKKFKKGRQAKSKLTNNYLSEEKMNSVPESSSQKIAESSTIWL